MANFVVREAYSPVVDQPFNEKSFTKELEGHGELDWAPGKKTVTVTTITTEGALNQHSTTKTYLEKLSDIKNTESTKNSYTLSQEYEIKQYIDKVLLKTNTAITAGGIVLKAIVVEQLTPQIDAYRLAALAAVATANSQVVTATTDGYADILKADAFLVNARLDSQKKLLYINPTTANSIRLSEHFIPYTESAEQKLATGVIGKINGATIKVVPADLLPATFGAILVNPEVVSAPRFLDDAKVTESSVDFGALIIGLYVYDLFVMNAKRKGVAAIKTA